jgi:serine/threonine protein kinase
MFNQIKNGKINFIKNNLFESIPSKIREIIAKMIRSNPKQRISASQLMEDLSKLTKIWKTQVRQNFFRAGRRRNNSFSVSLLTNKKLDAIAMTAQTNTVNPFFNKSYDKDKHVRLDAVFPPKDDVLGKKLVIKKRGSLFLSPAKRNKKENKKTLTSQTLFCNEMKHCRSRRSQFGGFHYQKEKLKLLNHSKDYFVSKNFF